MSWDLAAHENDLEMTNAKNFFGKEDFTKLYPEIQDSMDPIIPKGTVYQLPKVSVKIPAAVDSFYFGRDSIAVEENSRPFDLPWIVMDPGLARQAWRWQPTTDLETILSEIASHAEANPDWLQISAPL